MTKALVTGCAGFIGSHLAERLLQAGTAVIGIDSFTTNYDPVWKQRNLRQFLDHPLFEFRQEALQETDWQSVLAEIDVIYHQAALPGVRNSWGNSFPAYVEQNVTCVQQMLEACLKHGNVKKIVVASSSSVYGTMKQGFTDEQAPIQPKSPYGVTKAAMESICRVYALHYGLPIVMLRYFTVYGPRQRPDMAFHRFIRQLMQGQPISLYGDGRQSRDFTYVDDIVEANLLAGEKGQAGVAYNIGGDREISLLEIVQMIGELMQKTPVIQYLPEQLGDSRRTCADIRLAKAQLGYQPRMVLRDGLARQIADLLSFYQTESLDERQNGG